MFERKVKSIGIKIWCPMDLLNEFDECCKRDGRNRPSAIRYSMMKYIQEINQKLPNITP